MLRIESDNHQTQFRPGEEITGTVFWVLDALPERLELRLFWYTQGKGSHEVNIVETIPFERGAAQEQRPFHIHLPEAPYSFSGKLISLSWALELVAEPFGEVERFEFVLSPTGKEILLHKEGGASTPV